MTNDRRDGAACGKAGAGESDLRNEHVVESRRAAKGNDNTVLDVY
jgi:hypothetical protein